MAGDVVFVGCKMPSGVTLNLHRYELINKEQGTVRFVRSTVPEVTLKGNAFKFGQPDLSIDGYVFTRVPKDFWDEWIKRNADSSLIADGYIKPAATLDAGAKIAREHEKERGQFPRLVDGDERTRGLKVKKFDPKDDAA